MQYIRKFFIPWASLLWLFAGSQALAETVHISHCNERCPESAAARDLVVHHLYVAGIERETGLAEWVAYRVVADALGVASLLPRLWQSDRLLEAEPTPEVQDESASDFFQPDLSNAQDQEYRVNEILYNLEDRGRLAPMTSFAGTPYWQELNNLSNMAPLPTNLRVGSWARLEQAINDLAAALGEVYVVSGPLLPVQAAISDPGAYFKVVVAGGKAASFVFAADLAQHLRYCDQRASLQSIESVTGLSLFPAQNELDDGALLEQLNCVTSQ